MHGMFHLGMKKIPIHLSRQKIYQCRAFVQMLG